jgi:hypothetical protein
MQTPILAARTVLLRGAAGTPVEASVAILILLLSDVHSVVHRSGGSITVRSDAADTVCSTL